MDRAQDFITIALSIIVEATPFLVLGTILATLATEFNFFAKLAPRLPKNTLLRRLSISCMGVALPVCECGNVPLARSLVRKGFSIKEATTFLLAAPIVNPLTIITTKEAFRNVPWMMPARVIGGLIVALTVGELVGRSKKQVLNPDFEKTCRHTHATKKSEKTIKRFCLDFSEEFWPMLRLLIIGALIASFIQLGINQTLIGDMVGGVLSGVLIMLVLGVVISICSSVDAFFALSYYGLVKNGALLTFLIAGPMLDIKSISMLKTTYTTRSIIIMMSGIAVISVIIGVVMSYVG